MNPWSVSWLEVKNCHNRRTCETWYHVFTLKCTKNQHFVHLRSQNFGKWDMRYRFRIIEPSWSRIHDSFLNRKRTSPTMVKKIRRQDTISDPNSWRIKVFDDPFSFVRSWPSWNSDTIGSISPIQKKALIFIANRLIARYRDHAYTVPFPATYCFANRIWFLVHSFSRRSTLNQSNFARRQINYHLRPWQMKCFLRKIFPTDQAACAIHHANPSAQWWILIFPLQLDRALSNRTSSDSFLNWQRHCINANSPVDMIIKAIFFFSSKRPEFVSDPSNKRYFIAIAAYPTIGGWWRETR